MLKLSPNHWSLNKPLITVPDVLCCVPVIQGQDVWRVTYTPTEICAFIGSTVEISCLYTYPSVSQGLKTQVKETLWFTKESNGVHVDLRTDPEYSGRVTSRCEDKVCSLMITDLRESDSAEYKFRFTTNQPGGKYTGSPGVSLSVTGNLFTWRFSFQYVYLCLFMCINEDFCSLFTCSDLQVQVSRLLVYSSYNWAVLTCQSSCRPPGDPHYVWYKNGQNMRGQTSKSYSSYFNPADSVSCAVGGYEAFRSPPVCEFTDLYSAFHSAWSGALDIIDIIAIFY